MTKTITILYRATQHHRERVFAVLVACIFVTACAYIFLLQKAIVNVVQREKISKGASAVSMEINELEAKYFSLKNAITLELAYSKGLKPAEVTSYISMKSLTALAK